MIVDRGCGPGVEKKSPPECTAVIRRRGSQIFEIHNPCPLVEQRGADGRNPNCC